MRSRIAKDKSIYIACEGHRDRALIRFFLEHIFASDLEKCKISFYLEEDQLGGNHGKVIQLALRHTDYDKRIAFTDNDVKIKLPAQREIYTALSRCWGVRIPLKTTFDELTDYHDYDSDPVVIISTPLNVEGIVLQFLGKENVLKDRDFSDDKIETNKKELKSAAASILGSNGTEDAEYKYYVENFDKNYCIEKINKIPQLKLLIKAILGKSYCSKKLGIK